MSVLLFMNQTSTATLAKLSTAAGYHFDPFGVAALASLMLTAAQQVMHIASYGDLHEDHQQRGAGEHL